MKKTLLSGILISAFFVAQALILSLLQKELTHIPIAIVILPAAMAVITITIVVLHIVVNAEEFEVVQRLLKRLGLKQK